MGDPVDKFAFLRQPEEESFCALYEATRDRVWTICRRIVGDSRDDAEDAHQSVYTRLIRMVRAGQRLPYPDDLVASLARLAVLESDALRARTKRRHKRERIMEETPHTPDTRPNPHEEAGANEIRERVQALVAELPEHDRLAVQLHYFHGMTHAEVAQALGEPRTTTTSRIQRGLRSLEPHFRRAGLGDVATVLAGIAVSAAFLTAPPAIAARGIWTRAGIATGAAAAGGGIFSTMAAKMSLVAVLAVALVAGMMLVSSRTKDSPARIAGGEVAGEVSIHGGSFAENSRNRAVATVPDEKESKPVTTSEQAVEASPASDEAEQAAPVSSGPELPQLIVTGRVVYTTGAPAAGAKVAVVAAIVAHPEAPDTGLRATTGEMEEFAAAVTDRDGRFRIATEKRDRIGLMASQPGFARDLRVLSREIRGEKPGPYHAEVDLYLSGEARVSGRVIDEDGNAVGGARILAGPFSYAVEGFGGADGAFDIGELPPGYTTLRVEADGYAPVWKKSSAPQTNIEIVLSRQAAIIEGTVYTLWDNQPAAGVELLAISTSDARSSNLSLYTHGTSDEAGRFRFEGLPAGRAALVTADPERRLAGNNSVWTVEYDIEKGEHLSNLELYIHRGFTARGVVTDKLTGKPVANVEVYDNTGWKKNDVDYTDEEGRYIITGMFGTSAFTSSAFSLSGDTRVTVESKLVATASIHAEKEGYITTGASSSGFLPPKPTEELILDIELLPRLYASGLVVDTVGTPIPNARVGIGVRSAVIEHNEAVYTDTEGRFSLPVPGGVSFQMVIGADGYSELDTEKFLLTESRDDLRIVLEKARVMAGVVLDPEGQPIGGAEIKLATHSRTGGNSITMIYKSSVRSDGEGNFVITDIPPSNNVSDFPIEDGYLTFSCDASGFHGTDIPLENLSFLDDGRALVTLIPQNGGRFISGVVVDEAGNPVPRAIISAPAFPGRPPTEAVSDDDGRFRLSMLLTDTVDITITGGKARHEFPAQPTGVEGVVYTLAPEHAAVE